MKNLIAKPLVNTNSQNVLVSQILLISLVGFISMDVYFPSLPAISQAFGITQSATQITLTLFLCGFSISQLFYGPLSDYFGRRPVLLIGFFIFLLGSVFLMFASNVSMLFASRLIQGIGAGAGASLCRVLLRDNFVGNKMSQVASYITIGISLATALAPAVGGLVQQTIGFVGNFVIMFLFGLLVTLLVITYLPETNKNLAEASLHPIKILNSYWQLLKNKIFVSNMLCSGLALSALLTYAIINPFLLQNNLHLSPAKYGLLTLIIASGELVGTYINSFFVTRVGYIVMNFVGITIMLFAGILLIAFSEFNIFSVNSIVISTFILTMSIGIVIPNSTTGAFSELKQSIGTAGAIYGFFQILVSIITTYIISTIQQQTQWHLGVIFLALGITCLTLYSFSSWQLRKEQVA